MKYSIRIVKLIPLFCIYFTSKPVSAQIYYGGSGIVISYDATGNRLVRKVQTICLGPGCPPVEGGSPSGKPSVKNDTLKNPSDFEIGRNRISVLAYPNPTQELLYIRNEYWRQEDKADINVYDVAGKKLVSKHVTSSTTEIYFKEYAPGTYLVEYILNDVNKETWHIISK